MNSLSYINAKCGLRGPCISYVQSAISISWVSIRIVISQQRSSSKGAQRSFKRSVEGAPPLMNTLLVLPVVPRSRKSWTGLFAAARLVARLLDRLAERLSLLLLLLPSPLSSSFMALLRLLLLTERACFSMPSIHSRLSLVSSTFLTLGPASPISLSYHDCIESFEGGVGASSAMAGVDSLSNLGIGGGGESTEIPSPANLPSGVVLGVLRPPLARRVLIALPGLPDELSEF